MKKSILLLILLIIFSNAKISSIADIKQEYQKIKSTEKSLTTKKREISDISAEGAEATYYYDKGALKIVKLNIYGETFKSVEEYYFNNGKLFFSFSKDYRYNAPMYATEYFDPKKTKITTQRFYFINGKMVKWLDANYKKVPPSSSKFKNKQKEILNFVNKNLIDKTKK